MSKPDIYQTQTPGIPGYIANISCRSACPLGTDAKGYVVAVSEGRYLDAYRIARARNPLASVCGRACAAPCEDACNRGNLDAPVTIRILKAFATQQLGPESPADPRFGLFMSSAPGSPDPRPNGLKVAIVGAGPCGLTLAHDLARLGYRCTIFDQNERAGGQLLALPEDVLPARVLQAEIDAIASLGVEIRTGHQIPLDSLETFVQGFDAVVLATGQALPVPAPEGVFVAGNAKLGGAAAFIYAMADAVETARRIHQRITGQTLQERKYSALTPVPLSSYTMPPDWDIYPREDAIRLTSPRPVVLDYPETVARKQGARCLRCDINTVFDPDACTMCGLCVEICPEHVLAMVAGNQTSGHSGSAAVILKDDSRCTRCALCARICPEDAINMEALELVEEVTCRTQGR